MKMDELHGRYEYLRNELDAAYTSPVWDSERIDRIAEEMVPLERALSALQVDESSLTGHHHGSA